MFDLTDIKPAKVYPKRSSPKPVFSRKASPKNEDSMDRLERLSRDFEAVERSDLSTRKKLKSQELYKRNREAEGLGVGFDPTDFSGLRGKYDAEKADEIFEKDVKAGLIEAEPENEEFVK